MVAGAVPWHAGTASGAVTRATVMGPPPLQRAQQTPSPNLRTSTRTPRDQHCTSLYWGVEGRWEVTTE